MNNEKEGGEMTNAQLNAFLEMIAKRIEAEAKDKEEAAAIVREAKATD